MVFIVIIRNNFSRIMTQFVSVSKNLFLALFFSLLLGVICPSNPRFVARMDVAVRVFYSVARYRDRRFLSVPRYMLWHYVLISLGSILFAPCFWLLVCPLYGMI